MWNRIAALPRAARLQAEIGLARRREARALAAVGDAGCELAGVASRPELARAVADAEALRARREALRRAAAASLDQDRADWTDATSWLKLLIVARGLLARGVLRAQGRRVERALAPLLTEIGTNAAADPALSALLPGDVRAKVDQERGRAERAATERAELLAPFGGRALPPRVAGTARELTDAALGIEREARARLVPRLPSVVGLAAGWWIARAFTSSRWAAFTERLGLTQDGPWVVSRETYERLEFWVPLLAAALCAYLGSRFWSALERHYGGAPGPTPGGTSQASSRPAPAAEAGAEARLPGRE